MALSKDEVIQMAKDFLARARRKYDVRDAYLFGSFAKGTHAEYSDVDLAIVLGSSFRSEQSPYDDQFMIFHEAQEFNSRLEVVCFLKEEFDQDGGALARRVKKEGIKLL
jgi:predicted nucleotidyltransferase